MNWGDIPATTEAEIQERTRRLETQVKVAQVVSNRPLPDIEIFPDLYDMIDKEGAEREQEAVTGLIRVGEMLKINASAKVGKSWLMETLSLAVASGTSWILPEWKCRQGSVLMVELELPQKEFRYRMKTLCLRMGLPLEIMKNIHVKSFYGIREPAGLMEGLEKLTPSIAALNPSFLNVDPLVLLIPSGENENDNALMTSLIHRLNSIVARVPGSFGCVAAHMGKGLHADKKVVDTGRGGGGGDGAASTILCLRDHKIKDHYVVSGAARSFPPLTDVAVKFDFPLWIPTTHDPADMKGRKGPMPAPTDITDDQFCKVLEGSPRSSDQVAKSLMLEYGWSRDESRRLVEQIVRKYNLRKQGIKTTTGCGFRAKKTTNKAGFEFWSDVVQWEGDTNEK